MSGTGTGTPVSVGWLDARLRSLINEIQTVDAKQLLSDVNYSSHVDGALRLYSGLNPHIKTATVTLATGDYEYDLPTDWQSGFSAIYSIEYPSGSQEPEYLARDDYLVGSSSWRFIDVTPTTGESAIVTYSIGQTETTVPANALEGVAQLSAALACYAIAAKFAATTNPAVQADSIDYRSKSDQWLSIARRFEQTGYRILGIDMTSSGTVSQPSYGVTAQWEYTLAG